MAFGKEFVPPVEPYKMNGAEAPYIHTFISHVNTNFSPPKSNSNADVKELKKIINFLETEIAKLKKADEDFRQNTNLYTCAEAIKKYNPDSEEKIDFDKMKIKYGEIVLQIISRPKYVNIIEKLTALTKNQLREAINMSNNKVWGYISQKIPQDITQITEKDLMDYLISVFYDEKGDLRKLRGNGGKKRKLKINTEKNKRDQFELEEIIEALGFSFVDEDQLKSAIEMIMGFYLNSDEKITLEKNQRSGIKINISAKLPKTLRKTQFRQLLSALAKYFLSFAEDYPYEPDMRSQKLMNIYYEYLIEDFVEEVKKLGIDLVYKWGAYRQYDGKKEHITEKEYFDITSDEFSAELRVKAKQQKGKKEQGAFAIEYIEQLVKNLKSSKLFESTCRNLWLRDKSEIMIPIIFDVDKDIGFSIKGGGKSTEASNVGKFQDGEYVQSEIEQKIGEALGRTDIRLKKINTIQSEKTMSLTDFFLINLKNGKYARVQSKNIYSAAYEGIEGDITRQTYGKGRSKKTLTLEKYLTALESVGGNQLSSSRILQNYLKYWAGNLAFFVNTNGSLRNDYAKSDRQSIYEKIRQCIADIIGINAATIIGSNTKDIDILKKGVNSISSDDYNSANIYYWMRDEYLVPVWTILEGIKTQLNAFYEPLQEQVFSKFGAHIKAEGIAVPNIGNYSDNPLISYARMKRPSGRYFDEEPEENHPILHNGKKYYYEYIRSPGYGLAEQLYPQVRLTDVFIDFDFDILSKSSMVFKLIEKG